MRSAASSRIYEKWKFPKMWHFPEQETDSIFEQREAERTPVDRLVMPFFDDSGRRIKYGDLIRVYHYRDGRTRRKCYMHKLVMAVNMDMHFDVDGAVLVAVDVVDIAVKGLDLAHWCYLANVGPCEIINGRTVKLKSGHLECWYERDRERRPHMQD